MAQQQRPLHEIAREILADDDFKGNTRRYASAYLIPMLSLSTVRDNYGADSGDSIVRYALSNLQHYRGETARRVKAELKAHLQR